MRFTLILSALALLSSVLGGPPKTRTERAQPVSPHYNSHFERQLLGLNGCVTLNIGRLTAAVTIENLGSLLGLDLANNIGTISVVTTEQLCLCAAAGVITDDSVARVRTVLVNQGRLQVRVNLLGGILTSTVDLPLNIDLGVLARLFGTSLIAGLGTNPTPAIRCVFNAGAIPNSCTACTYDCPTNLPVKCDRGCRTVCPSGLSTTDRRRSRGLNGDFICPAGLTVCGMANHAGNLRKVECLDTQSNVEACGGCEYPLNGQVKGSDCTAINHTDRVACVAGQCVVESCRRGFVLIDGECVLPLLKQTRAWP